MAWAKRMPAPTSQISVGHQTNKVRVACSPVWTPLRAAPSRDDVTAASLVRSTNLGHQSRMAWLMPEKSTKQRTISPATAERHANRLCHAREADRAASAAPRKKSSPPTSGTTSHSIQGHQELSCNRDMDTVPQFPSGSAMVTRARKSLVIFSFGQRSSAPGHPTRHRLSRGFSTDD